jgi:hypothetical protein
MDDLPKQKPQGSSGEILARELEAGQELIRQNPVVLLTDREQVSKTSVWYTIEGEDGARLGSIGLGYHSASLGLRGEIFIEMVHVDRDLHKDQGYGEAAYKQVVDLQGPDNLPPGEYHFVSSILNDSSRRVWERLKEQGLARQTPIGYEYIQTKLIE